MEFQVQSVYLIYTWLIVYAILNLAYFKEYVYYIVCNSYVWYYTNSKFKIK